MNCLIEFTFHSKLTRYKPTLIKALHTWLVAQTFTDLKVGVFNLAWKYLVSTGRILVFLVVYCRMLPKLIFNGII